MARLGKWGYWLSDVGGLTRALVAWHAENLVGVVRDFYFEQPEDVRLLPEVLSGVEKEAASLSCEVLILMTQSDLADRIAPLVQARGYSRQDLESLHRIWRDVAGPLARPDDRFYAKRLLAEIVTQPV